DLEIALDRQSWDVILADYVLPHFSALAALKIIQARGLDVPFIVVSGKIGDETAVDAMKAGAHDYLMKGTLARLVPAIERELQEVRNRQEHRQAEEALRASERRLFDLINSLPSIVFFSRAASDLSTHYLSTGCLNVTGYTHEELLMAGCSYNSIIEPDDFTSASETIRDALAKGKNYQVEYRIRTKLGQSKWVWEVGNNIVDNSRMGKSIEGFISDISERKQMEQQRLELERTVIQMEELHKINQLKDDFLSMVSHELRTPMTNMRMAIHMLKTAPSSKQRQSYLKILDLECTHEISLMNDLLDLQRLEAGMLPLVPEQIVLADWLSPLLESFYNRAQERQQSLNADISPDLRPFVSDSTCLKRILVELMNNACKYTPQKGEISIRIGPVINPSATDVQESTANYCVQFSVSNSGPGIAPEELPRIFEKFYRIPNSESWKQGGTGLGLALAKKLVTQLGGNILVNSQHGETTFTVELPEATLGIID
ncbi:MAG: PAS domain-containing protein, partial [Gemmatimonadaceae bacterium]|nr:PAS domain-containing protein [Gloeobacterales cyanobacterium ES-bin-141]